MRGARRRIGLAISAYRSFDVRLVDGFRLSDGNIILFPQDERSSREEDGGFWVRGRSRTFLVIQTAEPAAELLVTLSSPVEGKTRIRVGTAKKSAHRTFSAGRSATLRFLSPRGVRWKGRYLYALQIEERSGFFPYKIDRNSQDKRYLGVCVRLTSSLRRR